MNTAHGLGEDDILRLSFQLLYWLWARFLVIIFQGIYSHFGLEGSQESV